MGTLAVFSVLCGLYVAISFTPEDGSDFLMIEVSQ